MWWMCLWLPYENHNLNIGSALWLMASDRILHPGEKTVASILKNSNNQSEDDEKLITDEMMMPLWFSCMSRCFWTVYHIYIIHPWSPLSSNVQLLIFLAGFGWLRTVFGKLLWNWCFPRHKLLCLKHPNCTFKVVVSYYWLVTLKHF